MFTPTLRCECAQPASDRLMRKWCIVHTYMAQISLQNSGGKWFSGGSMEPPWAPTGVKVPKSLFSALFIMNHVWQ